MLVVQEANIVVDRVDLHLFFESMRGHRHSCHAPVPRPGDLESVDAGRDLLEGYLDHLWTLHRLTGSPRRARRRSPKWSWLRPREKDPRLRARRTIHHAGYNTIGGFGGRQGEGEEVHAARIVDERAQPPEHAAQNAPDEDELLAR